jgi:hypothetical protein
LPNEPFPFIVSCPKPGTDSVIDITDRYPLAAEETSAARLRLAGDTLAAVVDEVLGDEPPQPAIRAATTMSEAPTVPARADRFPISLSG